LSVLPHMKTRRFGRIANITSFGGKVAAPHLVPYDAAKFAAVGFSEGMRAELLKDGILVTTVCPGLLRTGSHLNAYFKGKHRQEFAWFSFAATMPLISIDARRAARKIVTAIRHGDAELIITPQAKIATALHGLFPGLVTDVLGIVNRLLPSASEDRMTRRTGRESETFATRSFVQHLGRSAARELNQNSAQEVGTGERTARGTGTDSVTWP
jgi:short-subunit dehydrogenase